MATIHEMEKTAEDAAKTAERFPWGTSVVIALTTTIVVYFIMEGQIKYANTRADACQQQNTDLVLRIMMKNNIIDNMRDTVEAQRNILITEDSLNKVMTGSVAIPIISNKRKR